jgi:serine/threonine-protein kinase
MDKEGEFSAMKKFLLAAAVASAAMTAPVAALADDLYGAIAYSSTTGSYGWSTGFNTRRAAEREALGNCGDRARDCEVATYFKNACGSLAAGSNGGWGANWGGHMGEAERKAMKICKQNDSGCSIVVTKCADD